MIILGVDPGSRTTGYAFLEKRDDDSIRVLEYGTVSAKARDDFPDRLVKIVSGLEEHVWEFQSLGAVYRHQVHFLLRVVF